MRKSRGRDLRICGVPQRTSPVECQNPRGENLGPFGKCRKSRSTNLAPSANHGKNTQLTRNLPCCPKSQWGIMDSTASPTNMARRTPKSQRRVLATYGSPRQICQRNGQRSATRQGAVVDSPSELLIPFLSEARRSAENGYGSPARKRGAPNAHEKLRVPRKSHAGDTHGTAEILSPAGLEPTTYGLKVRCSTN
jgi:hypothetical protein